MERFSATVRPLFQLNDLKKSQESVFNGKYGMPQLRTNPCRRSAHVPSLERCLGAATPFLHQRRAGLEIRRFSEEVGLLGSQVLMALEMCGGSALAPRMSSQEPQA